MSTLDLVELAHLMDLAARGELTELEAKTLETQKWYAQKLIKNRETVLWKLKWIGIAGGLFLLWYFSHT